MLRRRAPEPQSMENPGARDRTPGTCCSTTKKKRRRTSRRALPRSATPGWSNKIFQVFEQDVLDARLTCSNVTNNTMIYIYKITKFTKIPKFTENELCNLYILQKQKWFFWNCSICRNVWFFSKVFWHFWCFCKGNFNS